MDASLLQEAIDTNRPFVIRTAAGDSYEVPHRDYIAFSRKRSTVLVSIVDELGGEKTAYIPLLTITSIETAAPAS